ncbi:M15 family metallopeptidase [Nitriliruptoraceae bacterium ZYF776]|nr:M15 family metallopeptidase [Profundirhabdus halotolerans]
MVRRADAERRRAGHRPRTELARRADAERRRAARGGPSRRGRRPRRLGLEAALDAARGEATALGLELPVSSGYRSASEQLALLEAEIESRGSREEALWWVAPPASSMHVRGLAVDINHGPSADWLLEHGARFGLCKTLAWEWWHFEWRRAWQDEGACPAPATTPDEAPGP